MIWSHPLWARDLESVARNLTTKTNKLVILVVPAGFALAALLMSVGNPKGNQVATSALMASILVLSAGSIFSWLQGVVA